VASGATHGEAAGAANCSAKTVQRLIAATGGLPPRNRPRAALRLSPGEREEISRGLQARQSLRGIAHGLGRAPSTVSREVGANGGRTRYRAWRADEAAVRRVPRPKPGKLAANIRLRDEVARRLADYWSPEQISNRLRGDYPEEPEMRVSHETIYRSLYVQGRGALRKELRACLRTGRTQRKPRGRTKSVTSGRIRDMVMISERPAEVADRAVPGHWEGDLILGRLGQSAVATLVERQTRFLMLVRLASGRTAELVSAALATHVRTLPEQLRRSLTWDQGKEMAEHRRFSIETGIPVYFCDPYSPWQRGSNENTNGLLRQYLPKATDLAVHDQVALDAIAAELNARPRHTLGWMTPSEKLEAVLR
jgi:IS30 family transposase